MKKRIRKILDSMRRVRRPSYARGFTLLELLVAMVVLSLLVVILMGMVDSAVKLWRTNENRAESYREARAAMNLIVSDLKVAVATTNTNFFQTTIASEFDSSPTDGSMFFLAALPPSAQQEGVSLSELCQVGYYLKYGKSGIGTAQQETYGLYRFFKESNETYNDLVAGGPMFSHSTTNVELLARNIPGFKVECFSMDTNGVISTWIPSTNQPMPHFVEIGITAYNNDAAKRLDDETAWKDTNSVIYRENSRTFTARIPIRQPKRP